jgi:hypothetical protein
VEHLQADKLTKVNFVPTKKNYADGNTKNVASDIHEQQFPIYTADKDFVGSGIGGMTDELTDEAGFKLNQEKCRRECDSVESHGPRPLV